MQSYTVKHLIDQLRDMDPDALVLVPDHQGRLRNIVVANGQATPSRFRPGTFDVVLQGVGLNAVSIEAGL